MIKRYIFVLIATFLWFPCFASKKKVHHGAYWDKVTKHWQVMRNLADKAGGYHLNLEEAKFAWIPENNPYGVTWDKLAKQWQAKRRFDGHDVNGGYFTELAEAKRSSDDLVYAYELKTGEESTYKLNFPRPAKLPQNRGEESIENKNFGVSWNKLVKKWAVLRIFDRNMHKPRKKWEVGRIFDQKKVHGGYFNYLEEAKHASDKLVYNYELKIGKESKHKLNFPRLGKASQNKTKGETNIVSKRMKSEESNKD